MNGNTQHPLLEKLLSDPTTEEATLQNYAYLCFRGKLDSDKEENEKLLKIIGLNPNCPEKVLWQIGARFPEVVLNNPVILLLVLDPDTIHRIPYYYLLRFSKEETFPKVWANFLEESSHDTAKDFRDYRDGNFETMAPDKIF